jgi:hypothetical protein
MGDAEGPTPTELALNILNKIKASRERKSRYCMRFMPVEQTCFASKEELAKTSALLIKKHFPTSDGVKPVKVRETTAAWLTRSAVFPLLLHSAAPSVSPRTPHRLTVLC